MCVWWRCELQTLHYFLHHVFLAERLHLFRSDKSNESACRQAFGKQRSFSAVVEVIPAALVPWPTADSHPHWALIRRSGHLHIWFDLTLFQQCEGVAWIALRKLVFLCLLCLWGRVCLITGAGKILVHLDLAFFNNMLSEYFETCVL